MKRLALTSLILLSILLSSCTTDHEGSVVQDFNFDWSFCLTDSGNNLEDMPASGEWREVRLPHDWSIEEGYTQEKTAGSNAFLPGGVGWYRKTFTLPSSIRNKEIFVRFEGVYDNSKVWINGEFLGERPNGYIDFEYELTPYLNAGGENEIVVYVDRRAYADARWYVGGGIYRNVHLIARNDIYFPTHGVYVNPVVAGNVAELNIETSVHNSDKETTALALEQSIVLNGECLATEYQEVNVEGETTTPIVNKITLESPELWSVETPTIYELHTKISRAGKVVDNNVTTFGVRTAVFDAAKGFLLNGESVKLKGVNLHHDFGCMGVALYDDVLYRRLKKLQDMGVNAIRTAHNPHSESLLAMCDTMGLLVMDEFVDEWLVAKSKWITQRSKNDAPKEIATGYSAHFAEWGERDLKDLIRRDRNHASIILWSVGNEIEWTYPYYWASSKKVSGVGGLIHTGDPEKNNKAIKEAFDKLSGGKDELTETAVKLVKWVKEMDKSRPVTSGVVIPSVSRLTGYTEALDVVGYNYKDTYYEIDHERYPDQPIFGSENVGQYYEWAAVADKEYISGIFLWTGIDYMGENGPWPMKGALYSLFDFACHQTHRGHFFETMWSDTPKTYVVTTPSSQSEFKAMADGSFKAELRKSPLRRWEWYDAFDKWSYADGEKIMVQVYSNAPQVELLLNGESLGVKNRADQAVENVLIWEVPYTEGELVAIGKQGDKEVSRYTLKSAGVASQIAVDIDRDQLKSDGYNLAHVELSLLDEAGTLVVDTPEKITVEIDGDLQILGVDNGSYIFVDSHKTNTIVTHNGRALLILQPKVGARGESEVTLTTESGIKQTFEIRYK